MARNNPVCFQQNHFSYYLKIYLHVVWKKPQNLINRAPAYNCLGKQACNFCTMQKVQAAT